MKFAKYHGAGNDFVVVDLRANPESADAIAIQDPAVVRAVCDRQFGIGGDGVLAVLPPLGADSDARMRVLNADGSEAEMCGNGIRCVVRELVERGGVAKQTLAIDTGAGRLVCEMTGDGVTVAMGRARLERGEIGMTGPEKERCVDQPIEVRGRALRVTAVSMGNPHAVMFVDDQNLRELAESLGPVLEHHAWFPNRTNVEFVRARSKTELDVVVWERGCGITLACGTGACATVAAAIVNGRADFESDVRVNLLGGSLSIRVLPNMADVLMHGPATHVFDGVLEPRAIATRPRP
ncbi:MAG TPA: diaminopimelate epimerase [Kofleriaceae bacterium]|jgi:diaminopimelate epimerase